MQTRETLARIGMREKTQGTTLALESWMELVCVESDQMLHMKPTPHRTTLRGGPLEASCFTCCVASVQLNPRSHTPMKFCKTSAIFATFTLRNYMVGGVHIVFRHSASKKSSEVYLISKGLG